MRSTGVGSGEVLPIFVIGRSDLPARSVDVVGDVGGLYLDFVHVALVLDLETVHPRHRGFPVEHAVCIFTGGAEVLGHPFVASAMARALSASDWAPETLAPIVLI